MTLTEFLTARLDEDEAVARAASGHDPTTDSFAVDVFIGRFNPARIIREVEAKRKILARHKRTDGVCAACGGYGIVTGKKAWPCLAIIALAAVYSDHPDYRQDWA